MDRERANTRLLLVDGAIAIVLAAITLMEISRSCPCAPADRWWSTVFMLSQTLPLAARRRYPRAVVSVVGASAFLYNVLDIPPQPFTEILPVVLATYTLAADTGRRFAIVGGLLSVAAVFVVSLPAIGGNQDLRDLVLPPVLLAAAWVAGDDARNRRRSEELLRERAERAERESAERARVATLEERARIARELHDVIAHSVGVIAVQAGAARRVVDDEPERAADALRSIEEVSRDAMVELRRVLSVLRDPAEDPSLGPQPGLASVDELLAHVEQAGLAVRLQVDGHPWELPPSLGLAAYRVIQEALTNSLTHAAATDASVRIAYEPDGLEVTIADRAGRSSIDDDRSALSTGKGLEGMRERVAMFAGTLETRTTDEGFVVTARFPYDGNGDER
jgi:signal transduction histidine kinase